MTFFKAVVIAPKGLLRSEAKFERAEAISIDKFKLKDEAKNRKCF